MYLPLFLAALSAADIEEELLQDSTWIGSEEISEPTTWDLQLQLKKYASDEESWRSSFGLEKVFSWELNHFEFDLSPALDGAIYGLSDPLYAFEPSLNLGLSRDRFRLDFGVWSSHTVDADPVYGDYLSLMWKPKPWKGGRFSLGPTFSYHSLDTAMVTTYFLGFDQSWQCRSWSHGPYLELEGIWEDQPSTMGKRGKSQSSIASISLIGNAGYGLSYIHSSGHYGSDFYLGYSQGVSPSSFIRQNSSSSSSGYSLEWNSNFYW